MIYDVVPTSIRHVKPMATRLRAGAALGLSRRGLDPRRTLHSMVTQSYICKTALIEGRPEAMWGLHGPLLSDAPYVWLALSERAASLSKAAVLEARRQLDEMAEGCSELVTGMIPTDRASIAFAVFLGFKGKLAGVSSVTRNAVVDELLEDPRHRVPAGEDYVIALSWRGGY